MGSSPYYSLGGATTKEGCRIVATSILSLLLPLSFLLLARHSTARYLSSTSDNYISTSIFFQTTPIVTLSFLVSIISVKTFINGLPFLILATYPCPPRIYMNAACISVCTMLILVVLGLQESADAGVNADYTLVQENGAPWLRRLFFGVGLYETMIYWWRYVVKPVVDENIINDDKCCTVVYKATMGLCLGGLWWWWLMEEAEALVVVPLGMHRVGVLDFAGWGLYSLTVMTGIVTILVKGYLCGWRDKDGDYIYMNCRDGFTKSVDSRENVIDIR